MKTAMHFAAIVAITLFLASAFTKLAGDKNTAQISDTAVQRDADVQQVVIVAEPLTLLERVQYDATMLVGWLESSLHEKRQVASNKHLREHLS